MNLYSKIVKNKSCYIIAEISANHNGNKDVALETIHAAKRAGANAVKIQTYKPETITLDVKNDDFLIKGDTIWDGKYLFDLYAEAFTPWEWTADLFKEAKKLGIECFSSPFDFTAVDFLEQFDPPAYKIASFEITDIPLIKKVASLGKMIIISTGVADFKAIELAVDTCRSVGNEQIILLKCTSAYPARIEDANLYMINKFTNDFDVVAGLSDHTLGHTVPVVSVALGAKVIEKHIILNKEIGGPDAAFSLDEQEFKFMVDSVRSAEKSFGKIAYNNNVNSQFARSLYISKDVKKGDLVSHENIQSVRPSFGLHPINYEIVINNYCFVDNYKKGTRLSWDCVQSFFK